MKFSIKNKLPMCWIVITCNDWLIIIYQILQYAPMLNYFIISFVWLKDNDFYTELIEFLNFFFLAQHCHRHFVCIFFLSFKSVFCVTYCLNFKRTGLQNSEI